MIFILKLAILAELIFSNTIYNEPIRNRHLAGALKQEQTIIARIVTFDETNETSMTEKEFFKIFKACVKECLKLKRPIQRDKCLAYVCDIY